MILAYVFVLAVLVLVLAWMLLTVIRGAGGGDRPPALAGIDPVLIIEGPGQGEKPLFERPMGVAVGKEGRIYVTDSVNNRVCVFDPRGRFLFEFGGFGVAKPVPGEMRTWRPGSLNFPVGIDIDEDGMVYVADFRNDQIGVFDADGRFVRSFPDPRQRVGKGGSGQDGQGIAVIDVAARGDHVYATDTYQVFVFTKRGELVRQFGRPGRGSADLDHPNGVDVGEDGFVYVSDSNHSRVTAFDDAGRPLWNTGSIRRDMSDETQGDFEMPRGIVAGTGAILVVDALDNSLALLDWDGRVTKRYGQRGERPGELSFPNDVAVAGSDKVVIADKGNRRVQVVRLLGLDVSLD